MNKKIRIAPSILSGDFGHLADEAHRLEQAGADAIHVDVMDGHFVPNLTLGPRALAAINRSTKLFLDVHLMIYNPYDYVERFIEMGADRLTFHFEATEEVEETLDFIKRSGVQAGLAFNPGTSMAMIPKFLDRCHSVLLMTVEPGFGGQKFITDVLEKIHFTKQTCEKFKIDSLEIQVDGGINLETGRLCVEAGANSLVSGNYLYQLTDMAKGIETLRNL